MPATDTVKAAYATVQAAEKKALEDTKVELVMLRDALRDRKTPAIIDKLPVMPGPRTPVQALLYGFDGVLAGWPSTLDSGIAQIDAFLANLNAEPGQTALPSPTPIPQ